MGRYVLDLSGSWLGPVNGSYKHGDEPAGFIRGGECLEELSDCWHLKWDYAAWSYIA